MNQFVSRAVALLAVLVGVLSLFGVRPMNTRAVELVLGTAALILGVALFLMTARTRRRPTTSPVT